MFPFIHIGRYGFATYGIMMATGMFAAYFVLRADLRRRGLALQPLPLIVAICGAGFVASRLYRIAEFPGFYWQHPDQILGPSGYAFYGGVIGAIGVVFGLARVYRMSAARLFDAVSPAAALGYGFGRVGCLLAGDGDYGVPTTLPWGMSFPHGLVPTLQRVHPTPIYEVIGALIITVFLWRMGRQEIRARLAPGSVFAHYLIWTGIARFLVEFIRLNPRGYAGLSNAQWVAIASMLGGAALLAVVHRRASGAKQLSHLQLQEFLGSQTMRLNVISRIIHLLDSAALQAWSRKTPLRFLVPLMVWAAAASAGGLFVYGCSGAPNSNETSNFNVDVQVTGLTAGNSVVVVNGPDSSDSYTTVSTNGTAKVIDQSVMNGAAYNVLIETQPSNPVQYCYLTSGGSGTIDMADATAYINCVAGTINTYTVGGNVSGLTATSQLVLLDNGSSPITATGTSAASVAFSFNGPNANQLPTGAYYNVTVGTQPANQYCYVSSGGGGVIGTALVNNVAVTCGNAVATPATVGGTVTNLTGSGLILQNNGGDNLPVALPTSGSSASFTFATGLPASANYNVTVLSQPMGQYCYPSALGGGAISSSDANVTTVAITCVDSSVGNYMVTGMVNGLTGTGLVIQDNGGDNFLVAAEAASFAFPTELPSTVNFDVTVFQQPSGQTCSVTNPTGGPGKSATVNCTTGNPAPILTSISPTSAVAGSASVPLIANGQNFVQGASAIYWNGTALTTSFVSTTELTATVPAADIVSVESIPVTVVTQPESGLGGGTSAAQTFSVTASNPAPTITSFSPPSAIEGSAFTLAINGTGFNSSTTVTFGGAALTATLQSPTQLTISVPADDATAGSITVVVTNPTPGGGSATDNFTITAQNPAPTITSLSPPSAAAGSTSSLTLTVNGTGYFHTSATNQSTVQWNGTALVTTYVSDTQLTTVVPSSDLTNAGSAEVTVVNPTPGGGTSNAETFSITSASTAPTILATVTNVAASGSNGFNSTISLYNIAIPLAPAAIGSALTAQNVQGIAIDASNDIYYVTNNTSSSFAGTATYYACPAPTAGAAYVCSAKGSLAGGAWLALDASGNAYATSIGAGTSTVVKFSAAAGPGTTPSVVYTASLETALFLGLAVSSDGSTLYVAESNNGSPGYGLDGLSIHVCSTGCGTDGTDITQTLVSAVGSGSPVGSAGLSGSLAIGPANKLYIGLANQFGSTTAPTSLPVVAVCTPGTGNTFACDTGTQAFPAVEGDLNPFNYAVGVAADPSGNAYVAAALNAYGSNTSPPLGPVFMAFQPPPTTTTGTSLTAFACATAASNGVPNCPINGLPAPGVVGFSVPPYSMAVTQP